MITVKIQKEQFNPQKILKNAEKDKKYNQKQIEWLFCQILNRFEANFPKFLQICEFLRF